MVMELDDQTRMNAHLGRQIRDKRRRLRLSQRSLADKSGVSQKTISQIERGEVTARGGTVDVLASVLGAPPSSLFGPAEALRSDSMSMDSKVPIYSRIPNRTPNLENELETYPIPRHLYSDARYCLRCDYDSMSPTVQPGDVLLLEHRNDADAAAVQGRICICVLLSGPVLGRPHLDGDGETKVVTVHADNPRVQAITMLAGSEFSVHSVAIAIVNRQI
jgi:transcriptional regulator with XRE-family HTH domain